MKIDIVKMPNFSQMPKAVKIPKSVMKDVMLDLRSDMLKRVGKGIDQNGKKFKDYAASTKLHKASIGKSNTVNMEETGFMRRGVQIGDVKESYGEIVVNERKKVGYLHQTGNARGGKKREWFGADKKSEKKAILRVRKQIKKQVAKI